MSARNFELFSNRSKFGNITVSRQGLLDGQIVSVKLHGNKVAVINTKDKSVSLSNCGWITATTCTAINTTLKQLNATLRVHRSKGQMFVRSLDDSRYFYETPLINGMIFEY